MKEGVYLLQPDNAGGGSQAIDLQPAQGGFVEFSLAEDGLYPIVTHAFNNVGKGALGLFKAGDGGSPTAAAATDPVALLVDVGAVILASTLADACGEDPRVACENVYDWTGNAALTELVDWFVDRPLIGLILLGP